MFTPATNCAWASEYLKDSLQRKNVGNSVDWSAEDLTVVVTLTADEALHLAQVLSNARPATLFCCE